MNARAAAAAKALALRKAAAEAAKARRMAAAGMTRQDAKPEITETKEKAKPEVKPKVNPEVKAEDKTESKTEVKEEVKADADKTPVKKPMPKIPSKNGGFKMRPGIKLPGGKLSGTAAAPVKKDGDTATPTKPKTGAFPTKPKALRPEDDPAYIAMMAKKRHKIRLMLWSIAIGVPVIIGLLIWGGTKLSKSIRKNAAKKPATPVATAPAKVENIAERAYVDTGAENTGAQAEPLPDDFKADYEKLRKADAVIKKAIRTPEISSSTEKLVEKLDERLALYDEFMNKYKDSTAKDTKSFKSAVAIREQIVNTRSNY